MVRTESTPDPLTLYVFAISHYCEKSRWTLDHLEIAHRVEHLAPGMHSQVAENLGAAETSLPILARGETVIQGSDAIFDWAIAAAGSRGERLLPEPRFAEESRALEDRLDSIVGVQTRRLLYSEALVEYPETVLPIFTKDLEIESRETLKSIWEFVREEMIKRMDLGRSQWDQARDILENELDWLDEKLSDGRPFLIGEHFSRVDITAASLIAVLAETPEHHTYSEIVFPPRVSAEIARWRNRPSILWARDIYRNYRNDHSSRLAK